MIYLRINRPEFWNDVAEVVRIFYPYKKVEIIQENEKITDQYCMLSCQVIEFTEEWECSISWIVQGHEQEIHKFHDRVKGKGNALLYKKYLKRFLKVNVFKVLQSMTQKKVPWGCLTGIRPTKLVHEMMLEGKDEREISTILSQQFFVEDQKIQLLLDTVRHQQKILEDTPPNSVSVYIGIPFCRSRCLYCSFPAYDILAQSKWVDAYLDALIKEIEEMGKCFLGKGYIPQSIYIGGGTPTSLSHQQLKRLLLVVQKVFEGKMDIEYTVEAGRPDTLDIKKLLLLKEFGVNRISINPQSMNGVTLKRIGRCHSPQEVVDIFKLAREVGFHAINMDIIIGLPGENTAMVENTLSQIADLKPDNVTVHTLAIKRASRLREELDQYELPNQGLVEEMLSLTQEWSLRMGMHPYYLYRQKYMMGNMENVGYALPGKECIYNVQIMEENQTILAMGAGAITKLTYPMENRLERVANVKNLEQYITRIDEMIKKKIEAL